VLVRTESIASDKGIRWEVHRSAADTHNRVVYPRSAWSEAPKLKVGGLPKSVDGPDDLVIRHESGEDCERQRNRDEESCF